MGYFLNMISFIRGSLKRAKILSPSLSGKFNLLVEESWLISLSSFQAAPTVSFHKTPQSSCAQTTCMYSKQFRVTSVKSPWQAVIALIHKTKWFTLFRLTLISSLPQEMSFDTILDKTLAYLDSMFLNIVAVSDSSLPYPASSVVAFSEKDLSLDVCRK